MTIEKTAQQIIDLTIAGPIPGGIGAQIRELAQKIIDECADSVIIDRKTYGLMMSREKKIDGDWRNPEMRDRS